MTFTFTLRFVSLWDFAGVQTHFPTVKEHQYKDKKYDFFYQKCQLNVDYSVIITALCS